MRIAATVNTGLTMLYWKIGERINAEVLKGARAEYGRRIVATLSQELRMQIARLVDAPKTRRKL